MKTKFAIYAGKGFVKIRHEGDTVRYSYDRSLSSATPFDTFEQAEKAAEGIDRSRYFIQEFKTKS